MCAVASAVDLVFIESPVMLCHLSIDRESTALNLSIGSKKTTESLTEDARPQVMTAEPRKI